jgi:hypothetical protein
MDGRGGRERVPLASVSLEAELDLATTAVWLGAIVNASCWVSGPFSTCPLSESEYILRDVLLAVGGLATTIRLGFLVPLRVHNPEAKWRPHGPGVRRPDFVDTLSGKRRTLSRLVAAEIVVAVLLELALVSVPQEYTMHEGAVHDLELTYSGIDTTQGTGRSFHSSAPVNISLGAWSCSADRIVCWGNGAGGSDGLVSQGGVYEFGTICPGTGPCWPANVTGTYANPILPR